MNRLHTAGSWREPHSDHLSLDDIAEADTRVESVFHQVDEGVVHIDLDPDRRMGAMEM